MIVNHQQPAPLENVKIFNELVHKLRNRNSDQSGLVLFYGPSGFGKSVAAKEASKRHALPMIACDPGITRKSLFQDLCAQLFLSYPTHCTYGALRKLVISELQSRTSPLIIIDEADYLFEKGLHEDIRALHDLVKGSSFILLGEERLPATAKQSERFDGRLFARTPARDCKGTDADLLSRRICSDINIAEDLLQAVLKQSAGSARRVTENLYKIRDTAEDNDMSAINLKEFKTLNKQGLSSRSLPQMRTF